MRVPWRYSVLIMVMLISFGCGYRFSAGGDHIDKGLKTVYVEPFVNKTSEANVENTFRAAVIDWLIKGGRFEIVDQADKADTIWSGSVNHISTATLSYRTSNVAAEERITVVLEFRFRERESQKEIWADRSFSAYQDYPISNVMYTDSARKNALSKLSMDTAERAYRTMMSGF